MLREVNRDVLRGLTAFITDYGELKALEASEPYVANVIRSGVRQLLSNTRNIPIAPADLSVYTSLERLDIPLRVSDIRESLPILSLPRLQRVKILWNIDASSALEEAEGNVGDEEFRNEEGEIILDTFVASYAELKAHEAIRFLISVLGIRIRNMQIRVFIRVSTPEITAEWHFETELDTFRSNLFIADSLIQQLQAVNPIRHVVTGQALGGSVGLLASEVMTEFPPDEEMQAINGFLANELWAELALQSQLQALLVRFISYEYLNDYIRSHIIDNGNKAASMSGTSFGVKQLELVFPLQDLRATDYISLLPRIFPAVERFYFYTENPSIAEVRDIEIALGGRAFTVYTNSRASRSPPFSEFPFYRNLRVEDSLDLRFGWIPRDA